MDAALESEALKDIFDYPGENCFSYGQIVELNYLMSVVQSKVLAILA